MSVVTLRANAHLAIQQAATLLAPTISYHVESEHPVVVFAVTAEALAAFRSGQNYNYWGMKNAASTALTSHDYTGPPPNGLWYLVIVNYNAFPTAVYYRVPS